MHPPGDCRLFTDDDNLHTNWVKSCLRSRPSIFTHRNQTGVYLVFLLVFSRNLLPGYCGTDLAGIITWRRFILTSWGEGLSRTATAWAWVWPAVRNEQEGSGYLGAGRSESTMVKCFWCGTRNDRGSETCRLCHRSLHWSPLLQAFLQPSLGCILGVKKQSTKVMVGGYLQP